MGKRLLVMILMVAAMAVYGCDSRSIVSDDAKDATAASDAQQKDGAATAGGAADSSSQQVISDDKVSSTDIASAQGSGADAQRGTTVGAKFDDVYFDYDSHTLSKKSQDTLMELATWLINNNAIALLEGHCDDRGTNEYNLALGDRRAASAKSFLLANGIDPRKIETVSYGEERGICSDQSEACWSRNRRVHFIVEALK